MTLIKFGEGTMHSDRGERHLVTAAESGTGDMATSPSRAGTPVMNGNEQPRDSRAAQPMTPVATRRPAPNRSDWAWRKAAEIYDLAVFDSKLPPTTIMDMIACELRTISFQGHVQGVEELKRIQKDWGCGND